MVIKLPYGHDPPIIDYVKHTDGMIDIINRNFRFVEFALKIMNFSIKFNLEFKGALK